MAGEEASRKITAIVAADVVGYSRLVAMDEEGTLTAYRACRDELIDPEIARFRGRIANTAGDSLLIEFPSVVDALRCMITIQRGMAERNSGKAGDRRIELRVGINVGDVVAHGDDLLGDGVNIAARLEGLADPGGISISSIAYQQVRDRVDVGFRDLGKKRLKNIPAPVHAYSVDLDQGNNTRSSRTRLLPRHILPATLAMLLVAVVAGLWVVNTPAPSGVRDPRTAVPESRDKPSIAVLPLRNLSNDPEQSYFSDGITTDLITDLSKLSGLVVIASDSSFQYRDREGEVGNVGRELGASHILTGSVRKAGDFIRVSAQLVEVSSGNHVWADRYDRELKDVFAVQDEVTAKIIEALQVQLTADESTKLQGSYKGSVEAYDLFLRGRREHSRFNREGNIASRDYFEKAIDKDPEFGEAFAFLAWTYARGFLLAWDDDPEAALRTASELARRAVSLDESGTSQSVLGLVQLYRFEHAEAVASLETSLELNPGNADSHAMLAFILNFAGLPEKSEALIATAMQLNPRHTYMYYNVLGQGRFLLEKYDDAVNYFLRAIERNPEDAQVRMWLASSYAQAGRIDEARWEVQELLSQNPGYTLDLATRRLPFKNPNHLATFVDGLERAGFIK
jgi:adenylate cyclase